MIRAQVVVGGAVALLTVLVSLSACSTTSNASGPSCTNGTKDDGEEGVDCGGTCPAKCTGDPCATGDQCASGTCDNATCAPKAGKPCGLGVGASCADGQPCELDKDCVSGFCNGATCATPAAGSHSDGQKNAGETGIDCGGSVKAAQPCPDGQGCVDSTDCIGTCNAGTCGPAGPMDGKKDNGETDVDCGGPNAPPCPDGKACATNTDCVDTYCPDGTKVCTAPTYSDGVQNGTETDVDCGGSGPGLKQCAPGLNCLVDGDCSSFDGQAGSHGGCTYAKKCVEMPSCKPKMGGDTCGGGDSGRGDTETHQTANGGQLPGHENCCRTLPLPAGYTAPGHPGKAVYLDKYEITAGRVRAFIEDLTAKYGGEPNMRAWVAANLPLYWDNAWNKFLPTGFVGDTQQMDHNPNPFPPYGPDVPAPWFAATGVNGVFGSVLYVYAHGHDTFHKFDASGNGSYGFTTFWLPPALMANPNNGIARKNGYDGAGNVLVAKDELDKKSMTAIPNVILVAFCHWDGGQLATDEVLDFVTDSPASLGNAQGCGNPATTNRCAPLASINATSDSGTSSPLNYNYPFYNNDTPTSPDASEGVNRLGAPGRLPIDQVKIAATDEPWMDLHGNLQESVLDMTGATFTGKFGLKYRGIGYNSARALTNPTVLTYPEYRTGYAGGRCMRFK